MRARSRPASWTAWAGALVLSGTLALCLGAAPAVHAQAPDPGVTDLTTADVAAIETRDIVDALALPRGTRIEEGTPAPTVRLPVYFEFDSAQLRPEAVTLLEKVGAALSAEELASFDFSVEGHTDALGPDGYNESLSMRRAKAVRSFLMERGVPDSRLTALGHGEEQPVAPNDSDEGRQRNRRVELVNQGEKP